MTPHHAASWTIIIPVKDTGLAKTRLTPFSQPRRAALALAFVLDAASAALQCPQVARVVAVTNDGAAGRALSLLGVEVFTDEPAAGLNPAIAYGVRRVRAGAPMSAVAAMCGDLPALQPMDLTTAFATAGASERWFVADAAGVGSTMSAAGPGVALTPAFGVASRERHRGLGIVDLVTDASADPLAGLRRDVDTLDDLSDARRLGVGRHTRAALVHIDAA